MADQTIKCPKCSTEIKLNDALTLEIRNKLDEEVANIYENAPQTSSKDYQKAEEALNSNEKPRADEEEFYKFLPNHLKAKK